MIPKEYLSEDNFVQREFYVSLIGDHETNPNWFIDMMAVREKYMPYYVRFPPIGVYHFVSDFGAHLSAGWCVSSVDSVMGARFELEEDAVLIRLAVGGEA